jgi:hypothetical protein
VRCAALWRGGVDSPAITLLLRPVLCSCRPCCGAEGANGRVKLPSGPQLQLHSPPAASERSNYQHCSGATTNNTEMLGEGVCHCVWAKLNQGGRKAKPLGAIQMIGATGREAAV